MLQRSLKLRPRRSVLLLGPWHVGKSPLIRGLLPKRSFADAHPEVPRFVASLVPEEYAIGDVRVVPWERVFPLIERALRGRRA